MTFELRSEDTLQRVCSQLLTQIGANHIPQASGTQSLRDGIPVLRYRKTPECAAIVCMMSRMFEARRRRRFMCVEDAAAEPLDEEV